jgi:hypothetical protein
MVNERYLQVLSSFHVIRFFINEIHSLFLFMQELEIRKKFISIQT